jgi:hypothetical protein
MVKPSGSHGVKKKEMSEQHLHMEENNGFKVPAGYFGQARNRLFHQVEQGGFKTPEDYFETARERVYRDTAQAKPTRVIALRKTWYLAAAAVLIVSGVFWFLKPEEFRKPEAVQVSNDEIINYVLASGTLNDIPLNELYTVETAAMTHEEEEIVNQLDEYILLNEL